MLVISLEELINFILIDLSSVDVFFSIMIVEFDSLHKMKNIMVHNEIIGWVFSLFDLTLHRLPNIFTLVDGGSHVPAP